MDSGDSDARGSSPISVSSEDSEHADMERSRRQRQLLYIINTLYTAIDYYTNSFYKKVEYHTSALTGQAWVLELLSGHPERICCELGVRHHVFYVLLDQLRAMHYSDGHGVMLEEQLAIFLYACVTGLTIRHVGERFQRANGTISQCVYFCLL